MNLRLIRHAAPLLLTALLLAACLPSARPPGPVSLYTLQPARQERLAADKGIKKYTVGKKSVDCKLFLDFIVFDEHTCKAEAPVCW